MVRIIILSAMCAFAQSGTFRFSGANFLYTTPPGWTVGAGIGDSLDGVFTLNNPTYPGIEASIAYSKVPSDWKAPAHIAYELIFDLQKEIGSKWTFDGESVSIRVMLDTTVSNIKYIGCEFNSLIAGQMIYCAIDRQYIHYFKIRAQKTTYESNRLEFYKNFQEMRFITPSSEVVLMNGAFQKSDREKIYDVLGRLKSGNSDRMVRLPRLR